MQHADPIQSDPEKVAQLVVEKQALMNELAYFISCAHHKANPAVDRVKQAEEVLRAVVEKDLH